MRGLVKLEAEYGGEDRANRKAKCFTLVWRFGAGADRIERHISTFLNAALAEANRTKGGGKVQCWRDKTRGEKRRRAQARQDREGGEGGGADAGKGKAGRGKGKVAGDGRGRGKGKAAGLVGVKVRDAEAAKAVVSKHAMAPPGVDACPGGLENMGIKVVGPLVV